MSANQVILSKKADTLNQPFGPTPTFWHQNRPFRPNLVNKAAKY